MDTQLTWLLDEKQEESGASDLKPAIEAVGDGHVTISRKEARHGSEQTMPLHSTPALAYGSIELVKSIRTDFYPGRWSDWTALRCDHYYAKLGALLFNDDYILLPAGEVRRRQAQLLQSRGQIFLRPVRADKPFAGFVARADVSEEIDRRLESMDAHDLVVVASVKEIDAEYRTVAVRGKGTVAASQYLQHGQLHIKSETPAEVKQVAEEVVKIIGMDFSDPMYVVDIAKRGDGYRLLEINGFSFSCFYACDLEAIVRSAHEEAVREWQEMQV